MKRLFKRKKKNPEGSPTDRLPVTQTKPTSQNTEHPDLADIDEAGYSFVRSVKAPRVRTTRQRADGRSSSSGHELANAQTAETESSPSRLRNERPRMDSPVGVMTPDGRNAALSSNNSHTEPPYAKVNKRKSKKIGAHSTLSSNPNAVTSVGQSLSVGETKLLSKDVSLLKQLQQRSETSSSNIEGDVTRSREKYSPAHFGKLEIVRQGSSFVVERQREDSFGSPHYDVLEQEDHSMSESLSEAIYKRENILGKAHSEGEICMLEHIPQGHNNYDHVISGQTVEHSLHKEQLADYDRIHAAHSEPLKTTSHRSSYQWTSPSLPQIAVHTTSHSPSLHVSHRQRDSSPGEQTTASAPDTYSRVSPRASQNNRVGQFDDADDDGPLQLLHLSATSLASAKSEVSGKDTIYSIVTKKNEDQKKHEVSAQLAALHQVVAELQVENETLKELSSSVQEDSNAVAFLRREKRVLSNDNRQLRDMVHRLAVELSRYQARYPDGPPVAASVKSPSKETVGAAQVIFTAYDDRLKEKDDILSNYENHLKSLKQQIAGVAEENKRLVKRVKELTMSQPISSDEWLKIQDEVKVVVEENSLLIEEREIQRRKMKAQLAAKEKEVVELSDQISTLEDDKKELQDEIKVMNQKCNELKEKCERLTVDNLEKMPIEEHLSSIEECHRVTQDVERRCKAESVNAFARLQAIQKEKQSLETERAEAAEHVARLQATAAASRRAQERCQRQIASLRNKLVAYKQREITLVGLLQKAVEAAEKAQAERNAVGELVQEREKAVDTATILLREDDTTIGRLQERFERHKALAKKKLNRAVVKMNDRDKEHQSQQSEYLEEIRHLQVLLRDKQRQLESMTSEKRNMESQLSLVVKSVRSDNNAVRASLRRHEDSAEERMNSDDTA